MKYCVDCRWMGECEDKNGKFPCQNSKSNYKEVSARMQKCNAFGEVMGRDEWRKEQLMKISKSHGYYIVTAVCETLGLGTDNVYMDYFMYVRDVVMPNLAYGNEWIADYEEFGPKIADTIVNAENKEEIAGRILNECLNPFVELMIAGNVDDAITVYQTMVEQEKVRCGLTPKPKKLALINNEMNN